MNDSANKLFEHHVFDESSCFLCGDSKSAVTKEHVFPKWLLKKFNLWDKKLTLLNKTKLPYRLLTVPCCSSCNNGQLSSLENQIKTNIESGYQAALLLDTDIWFLWLTKLYYGILRKELYLKYDRSNPNSPSIIAPSDLQALNSLHLFLQQVLDKHYFVDHRPYSLFLTNLHVEPAHEFFCLDTFFPSSILLRLGGVGVFCIFEDMGNTQHEYGWYLKKVAGRKLHRIQFHELYAYAVYQSSRLTHTPSYTTLPLETENESQVKITTMNYRGHIADWNRDDFLEVFYYSLKSMVKDKDVLRQPDGKVTTWMSEDGENPYILSLDEWNTLRSKSV